MQSRPMPNKGRSSAAARRCLVLVATAVAAAIVGGSCCGSGRFLVHETAFAGSGAARRTASSSFGQRGGLVIRGSRFDLGPGVREFMNTPAMRAFANPGLLFLFILVVGGLQDYGPLVHDDYRVDPCSREVPWLQQKYFGKRDCRSSDTAGSAECVQCKLKKQMAA